MYKVLSRKNKEKYSYDYYRVINENNNNDKPVDYKNLVEYNNITDIIKLFDRNNIKKME